MTVVLAIDVGLRNMGVCVLQRREVVKYLANIDLLMDLKFKSVTSDKIHTLAIDLTSNKLNRKFFEDYKITDVVIERQPCMTNKKIQLFSHCLFQSLLSRKTFTGEEFNLSFICPKKKFKMVKEFGLPFPQTYIQRKKTGVQLALKLGLVIDGFDKNKLDDVCDAFLLANAV